MPFLPVFVHYESDNGVRGMQRLMCVVPEGASARETQRLVDETILRGFGRGQGCLQDEIPTGVILSVDGRNGLVVEKSVLWDNDTVTGLPADYKYRYFLGEYWNASAADLKNAERRDAMLSALVSNCLEAVVC